MGIFAHLVNAEIVADGIEEVVARVAKRRRDVFLRVSVVFSLDAVPDPALRRVSFRGVLCEDTFTLDLVFRIDLAFCQNRCRNAGFEGRSRGVGTHQRTVEKRCIRGLHQFLILLDDARAVISGPACDRERLPGVDLYHNGRSAGDLVLHLRVIVAALNAFGALLIPVHDHGIDGVVQNTLRLFLKDLVDGQVDMGPRLRFFDVDSAEHRAGVVLCFAHRAVLAVQVFLKGVFHAVLSHHGVVCIVQQRIPFILLLRHQSGVAEDVGGVFRLVIADVGTLNFNADQLVFHDG